MRIPLLLYGLAPVVRALSKWPFGSLLSDDRRTWIGPSYDAGLDGLVAGPVEPAS